ncbi:MAG: phosphomannomutase/phosphoglucomutase [Planctomycetales bacterium]|nr:phosphomannomutase/phosphoglucomutase [Planctomycetales bacterium]
MGIFKAYDVRGVYPDELDERKAERIGAAFAAFLGGGPIAVGRDMRSSSPAIAEAVARGVRSAGAEVVDVGMVSTPALYFAVVHLGLRGGAQVTASHNPARYTGLKLCREQAAPVGEASGLREIEKAVSAGGMKPSSRPGGLRREEIGPAYRQHVRRWLGAPARSLRVVVDAGNAMGGTETPLVFGNDPKVELLPLFWEPDGTFPNHEPNPLKPENLRDLRAAVVQHRADCGAALDGDADRCAFVDERGEAIPCDAVTVLLARSVLAGEKGAAVVYDLRSSDAVPEIVRELGGRAIRERVGHAFIKATMRKENAALGGELSGHYYFRDNSYCDSGAIALACVLNVLGNAKEPLSKLVAPARRYYATGEVNFHVADPDGLMEKAVAAFPGAEVDRLDGVTVRLPKMWFNLRKSNTEPILRLNLEGKTGKERKAGLEKLLGILGEPEGGRPSFRK